jgi:hypothetical protein
MSGTKFNISIIARIKVMPAEIVRNRICVIVYPVTASSRFFLVFITSLRKQYCSPYSFYNIPAQTTPQGSFFKSVTISNPSFLFTVY